MDSCRHVRRMSPAENHSVLNPQKWSCASCDSSESIWACLNCSHVACGPFLDNHMLQHFKETKHPLAMEVSNKYVFCFECDNYVLNDNSAGDIKILRNCLQTLSAKDVEHQPQEVVCRRSKRIQRSMSSTMLIRCDLNGASEDVTYTELWFRRYYLLAGAFNHWKSSTKSIPKEVKDETTGASHTGGGSCSVSVGGVAQRSLRRRGFAIPGITGLQNLGNTCYMNSILQVLRHVYEFSKVFIGDRPPLPRTSSCSAIPNVSQELTPDATCSNTSSRSLVLSSNSRSPFSESTELSPNSVLNPAFSDESPACPADAVMSEPTEESPYTGVTVHDVTPETVTSLSNIASETSSQELLESCTSAVVGTVPESPPAGQRSPSVIVIDDDNDIQLVESAAVNDCEPSLPEGVKSLPNCGCRRSRRQAHKIHQRSLLNELHSLLRVMCSGKMSTVVSPHSMLYTVWNAIPFFRGYSQQDAQEFLSEFLDKVQSEMDNKSMSNGCVNNVDNSRPVAAAADNGDDVIRQLFQGELVSEVKCLECGYKSYMHEPFMDLSLEFPDRYHTRGSAIRLCRDSCTLDEMLTKFTEVEKLEGQIYACDQCNRNRRKFSPKPTVYSEAEKCFHISQLPNVLRLHLKRFMWSGRNNRGKIPVHVTFATHLNVQKFCHTTVEAASFDYHLSAVVMHHGRGFGSGHYTSYCWNDEAGSWIHCNDAKMRIVSVDEVCKAQAYILIYVRTLTSPASAAGLDDQKASCSTLVPRFSDVHNRSGDDSRSPLKRRKTTIW